MATGEVVSQVGDLSRFAVMQHLGVLEEAGVVVTRRAGRRRLNHLNPVPIREIYERWVSLLAERDARAWLALRRHVEGEGKAMEEARKITLESERRLKATPERVWEAVTDEQADWYPYSYGGERLKRIVTEPGVGGRVYEDWGEGAGHLYSHITHWDPPRAMGTLGFLGGAIADEMAEGIRSHGSLELFEDKLRAWVEQGERATA